MTETETEIGAAKGTDAMRGMITAAMKIATKVAAVVMIAVMIAVMITDDVMIDHPQTVHSALNVLDMMIIALNPTTTSAAMTIAKMTVIVIITIA